MKKRILIIDDEQFLLNTMQRDLREYNDEFEIYTNTNSMNTLKFVEELAIDLLITDIYMPDKNGLEIIREVRKKFPAVKLIAMSGRDIDYLNYAEVFGSTCSLSKPFSKDDLIMAINSAFHEK